LFVPFYQNDPGFEMRKTDIAVLPLNDKGSNDIGTGAKSSGLRRGLYGVIDRYPGQSG